MSPKSMRSILLILTIIICFNQYSYSQKTVRDSLASKNVNVAYGTQPSWMVTGAISTVKGSDLLQSFTPNMGNRLIGRIPGLTVNQGSGEPGSDSPSGYFIRGINTYGSGKSILIIVDGVESSAEGLVPEEIETISILKDASELAFYGSRGANGVMLITTKRGIESPMVVNFSTQQGFTQAHRLPEFLGSYDYANLYNEALANSNMPSRYTSADLDAYQNGSDKYFHPDVNWYKEVLRNTAPASNYNLTVRGGDPGVHYFVLLNAMNRNGLIRNTEDQSEKSKNESYNRFNVRSNIDVKLTDRLSATLLIGGSIENKTSPVGTSSLPTSTSFFNNLAVLPPNSFPVYNPNKTIGGNSLKTNPLADILYAGFYESPARTLQSTFKMTQKLDFITDGLSVSGLVSFNSYYAASSYKTATYARFALSQNALGDTIYNKIGQVSSLNSTEGMLSQWRNSTVQAFLNYDRTFGNNQVAAIMMVNNEIFSIAGTTLPNKYLGLAGRFSLANREKYITELTFAYTGNGDFPKNHNWGIFPAISLGWVASNESFLKDNSVLSYLKLRGSYGMVGNDNIGGTRFMFNPQPYVFPASYIFGTTNTAMNSLAEGMITNPDVTWEKETKLNIGLEATLFNQVDIALDIFKNDRSNILSKSTRTIPQYLGFGTLPDYNLGKSTNHGFEAMIRYNSKQNGDFQFYAEANIWYAKNKIVYNAEATQIADYLYRTGHMIDQPFMLESLGFFKDQADVDASPLQIFSPAHPGDIKYKDQNGDGIVNTNDYVPTGYTTVPQITATLESGLKFKGFDLNFLFQAVTHRSVYLNGNYYQAFQNNGQISSVALGRWTPATSETATYPRLSAVNDITNFQPSSFWQRDGSFIKLRSIELGYNLTGEFVKKIHLNSARFFINGTDLFSLDHMYFTDPENLSGYPAVRTCSIGARIQF